MREIHEHYVGALLHSFEDDFAAVRGYVKVADIEVGGEVSQLAFGAGFEVDEPEILMLNFSS